MKSAEIRLLSNDELRGKLEDAKQENMNLRFQIVTGQMMDTSRLKKVRRNIARFETIIHQRELEALQERKE